MKTNTKELLKMIIKLVVPVDKRHRGAHNKFPLDHYIDVICYVLRTGIQWKELRQTLHFSTYHKKFVKWARYDVFKIAYQVLIKLLKAQKYITDDDLKNLFIDSSMIKNIHGHKNHGVNHYDRGRKGNKVTVIVTKTGIPIAMTMTTSNKHDVSLVEQTLDQISIKILGSRLIADKGYVSKKLKIKLRNHRKVYLICPKKKNQKNKQLPDIQRKLLSERNIVENFFAWSHNYKRIRVRYERHLDNYIQFYYLAMIEIIHGKIIW